MNNQATSKKRPSFLVIIIIAGVGLCAFCVVASMTMNALGLVPTLTPSEPPTSTVPPPTATAVPTSTETATPLPPDIQTAQALGLTQTMIAFAATEITQYQAIDPRELLTYPDNHLGEDVYVRITIFNIITDTELQGYFVGTFDAIYVIMREPFTGIYADDIITVYGSVAGTQCGTNAFGAQVCQPLLVDSFFTK